MKQTEILMCWNQMSAETVCNKQTKCANNNHSYIHTYTNKHIVLIKSAPINRIKRVMVKEGKYINAHLMRTKNEIHIYPNQHSWTTQYSNFRVMNFLDKCDSSQN